jgi:hypothetical protein
MKTSEKIKVPGSFWKELEAVYSSESSLEIKKGFWEDLNAVYLEECQNKSESLDSKEPSDSEFKEFQKALDRVVSESEKTVKREMEENPDHPLFLPFSLFEPMDKEQSEVHFTKTLVWFMKKDAKHGFEDGVFNCLFPLFYNECFDSVVSYDVESERCETEERRNRFDIKISGTFGNGKKFKIVVEAKVNAEEGEEQLKRYERECSKDTKLVFLTPDGRKPKTTKNLERWKCISWQEIALNLINYMETLKNKESKTGFHLLKYFTAGIIREIDGAGIEDNPINLISYINKIKEENTND